jgi:hypothetical protein
MLAPPEVPCNASRARNTGRPKEGKLGKRGQSSEEVRVRHQMGEESARTQALLYVVPKVCASAIWPFLKTSPHPDRTNRHPRGMPISSAIMCHNSEWIRKSSWVFRVEPSQGSVPSCVGSSDSTIETGGPGT